MTRQIIEAVGPPLRTKLKVTTDGMAPHDMANEDRIQECAVHRNDHGATVLCDEKGVVLVNFLPG